MNPAARRVAILVIELMTFILMTAFTTYFISHAGALDFAQGEAPPAPFPVLAYDGDRSRPAPKHYAVVPWSEWDGYAAKRPGASLLLPERSGRIPLPDGSEASFTAAQDSESRQSVDLKWTGGRGEQHVRYVAQARSAEPLYYRTVTANTFMLGAVVGFVAGLLAGRVLRRRWLAQPGFYAPPPTTSG